MIELLKEKELSSKDKIFKQQTVGKTYDFEKSIKFTSANIYDSSKDNELVLIAGLANGNLVKERYPKLASVLK